MKMTLYGASSKQLSSEIPVNKASRVEFSQDGGNDRENWAGHVCRGRDRVTITFQLIKNQQAPAECNGLQLSLGRNECLRYALV